MRILSIFSILLLMSCSPKLSYLGDSYDANLGNVDTYYDIGDIKREFKVIGLLTANTTQSITKSLEKTRDKMIEEAAVKGADAILFVDFYSTDVELDNSVINAKLLRYK